jgi:hypothetical protein
MYSVSFVKIILEIIVPDEVCFIIPFDCKKLKSFSYNPPITAIEAKNEPSNVRRKPETRNTYARD